MKVDLSVSNPLRCFNCNKFGHTSQRCKTTTKYQRCGKDKHEEQCDGPQICSICNGPHAASAKVCRVLKKEKEIQRIRRPCAWKLRSSTWRHRSGLGAQNWTLTQPPGSKSGAWEKHWVQHQETQNSCPLATRTRAVPGRRSKPALASRRKPGYRSIPIRDRQEQVKQNGQSALECPKKPR